MIFDDFLKTKKMRNVRTVILAAVSRRDLYYVSENESFCFGQKTWSRDGRAGRKSPDFFEPCAKAAKDLTAFAEANGRRRDSTDALTDTWTLTIAGPDWTTEANFLDIACRSLNIVSELCDEFL